MERYLAWKYLLLAAALLVGGVAYSGSGQLSYEGNVERFFPDATEMDAYRHLKSTFGGNEIVLAVYVDEQLFAADGSGIDRLRKVRQRIEQVPNVTSVLSLDRALGNWLAQENQGLATRLRTLFEGYTHGSDGKTVALACMLKPHAIESMVSGTSASLSRRETLSKLRHIMQSLPAPLSQGVLTGEPVLVSEGLSLVERDGARLGRWSMGLLGLTIAVCFRKIRWIVFPLAIVAWSTLVTRAVLAWSGLQLSLVSSMLTAVVTVVGVATVIHIVVQYEHALCVARSPILALSTTLKRLAVPITWAIATDAVGFLSLTFSHVVPVKDFGVMMAVGSVMVLVGVFLMAPAIILWRASSKTVPQSQIEVAMAQTLSASIPWIYKQRVPLSWGAILFFLVTGWGGFFLEVETDFTRNFRDASPIVSAYRVVEEQLGGAG
ncbi:MAG: MMPL family transporter, partial [Planctomycetota bacterium]|nr:MMPL family transporter [Planctomycetota bacterium]